MNVESRTPTHEVLVPAPLLAYSERLGHVTAIERRLEEDLGATVSRVPLWSHEDIREHAGQADAVFVGAVEPMDATALASLPRCRLLLRRGVGVNNIDLEAATDLGIPVAYVPSASVQEVSDHALALLLAIERRVATLDTLVKGRRWSKSSDVLPNAKRGMRRLSELTLGIVGYGRIGQELGRKAGPLFARQVVFDPFAAENGDEATEFVSFEELLRTADIISLHAPLTPDTKHMFNDSTLGMVKQGCTLVNTSRGGLIDTAALRTHLRLGRLSGAGLDVTEEEPISPDDPLLDLPSVLLTGHSAASSESAAAEMRTTLVEAAIVGFAGRDPEFVANPEVLQRPDCRIRPTWAPTFKEHA